MNNDLQVLFVGGGDPEDGAPHPCMAAIWLCRHGYRVECVCPGPRGRTEVRTPLATLKTASIPFGRSLLGKLAWQMKVAACILKHRFLRRPRLFYVHGSAVAPGALLGLLFAPRERVVYQTQDLLEPGKHLLWAFFERRLARRAGHVLSNEPNRARFLASYYRLKKRPLVIRTALPRDWPMPERDPVLRQKLLMQLGRSDDGAVRLIMAGGGYSPLRCSEELIQAVNLLDPRYVLVFTGMKPGTPAYQAARGAVLRAGIEQRVLILPHLEYDDLLRHMAACDIGILLYPDDGVGNFYQAPGRWAEYLGVGLPFVTSNFPGLELLALKHGAGICCDPTSPRDIAAAIDRLGARGEEEQQAERNRLRYLARMAFAYENDARAMEKIVRDIATGKDAEQEGRK